MGVLHSKPSEDCLNYDRNFKPNVKTNDLDNIKQQLPVTSIKNSIGTKFDASTSSSKQIQRCHSKSLVNIKTLNALAETSKRFLEESQFCQFLIHPYFCNSIRQNKMSISEPPSLKLARNAEACKTLNSCTKVVNDGKAFRNYRLQKLQRNKTEKQDTTSNTTDCETEELKNLKNDGGKYKFFRFGNKISEDVKGKVNAKKLSPKFNKNAVEGDCSTVESELEYINKRRFRRNNLLNKTNQFGDTAKIPKEPKVKEQQQKINSKCDKTLESDSNEDKSKAKKKIKNSKIKGDENSNAEIVDAMESILKDNEKFRSTPIRNKKTKQTQNEEKKSGDVSEDNVNKQPKKKILKKPAGSTQIGNVLNNLENKITNTLKQSKLGKTSKINSTNAKPKNNIPLASKNELAKTLFSGQSWIEGNKALKESTNALVSLGNSNLESVLSKEIVLKTNNGKCRRPFGLSQQVCKEEVKTITEIVPVETTGNQQSDIKKSDTPIDKQLKCKSLDRSEPLTKEDLPQNCETSNKLKFSTKIITQTPEASVTMNTANTLNNPNNTDTEMILQTAPEKPLANLTETLQGNSKLSSMEKSIQLHTNKTEIPLKYFEQKYIESNIHITSKTILNTTTQQIPAEPHLKIKEDTISDSILPPGIFAEPNLKVNTETQEEININTRTYTEASLELNDKLSDLYQKYKTHLECNKTELDLKASTATTEMKLKPVTKTIRMFNSSNEKSIEMKVKIFTDPNSKKFSKDFDQNNINNSCSLECYNENNDSTTTKACLQYSRTAQQALSVLNDEVSSVLRDSFCSIDDIWQRVCQTIDEINECNQQYNKLQDEQRAFLSQSTPQLIESSSNIYESKDESLLHALSLGLVQTQSENQVRLAVMPMIEEKISGLPVLDQSSDLQIPPIEADSIIQTPVIPDQDECSKAKDIPILPKLIPVIETYDQPCTVLKQQKRDVYNIPTRISTIHEDNLNDEQLSSKPDSRECITRKSERGTLKTPSTPLTKIHTKKFSRDISPELKQKLKEIALRLGLDNLPRMKAQQNIHAKLIKEFDATDSLIEFRRQMKQANEAKAREEKYSKDAKLPNEMKEANSIKSLKDSRNRKRQPVQIMAEELFVPEKKINKIAATNLNPVSKSKSLKYKPKCCQFLYREKKKKKDQYSNLFNTIKHKKELDCISSNTLHLFTKKQSKVDNKEPQQKYLDSLWFSNNKRKTKLVRERSVSTPISATNSSVVCRNSNSICDLTAVQTQTDNKTKYFSQGNNLQSINYKTGLDCFDILDEISLKDLKPLESEYPRKDHMGSKPCHTPVEDTYLYKLVYGSAKDQFLQLLRLEEPSLQCNISDCQLCHAATTKDCNTETSDLIVNEIKAKVKRPHSKRKTKNGSSVSSSRSNVLQSKSLVSTESKQQSIVTDRKNPTNSDENKKRRSVSTDSTQSMWLNSPDNKRLTNGRQWNRSKTKKTKKFSQDDVIEKLRPYIFDPRMRYPTTITVMPVSVTTTYANPNFIQNTQKHRSGDYSPPAQPVPDKYRTKAESKDKSVNRTQTTKQQPAKQLNVKKLWNNKYSKSAGSNLMSYLERQNLENPQQRTDYTSDDNFINNVSQETPVAQRFPRRNQNQLPIQTNQVQYQTHSPQSRLPTSHLQQSQLQRSAFMNSPQTHTAFIGQVPQLHTTSVTSPPQTIAQKTTTPFKSKTTKQIPSPKVTVHKSGPGSPSAEKDIQQFLGKRSLESNIQNVIDMIEGKIVDIVSSPDQTHSETFDNVEKQIVQILQTIKSDQSKPLDCIEEQDVSDRSCSDKTKKQDGEKKKRRKSKIMKCHAKTTSNLNQPAIALRNDKLHSETFPHLTQKRSDTSHTTISQETSSNEEHFVVTSSCSPSKTKTPVRSDRNRDKSELLTNRDKERDMQVSKKNEEIHTDQFLTPFMRTLKKYREREPPLNVLEFLDTLTNLSDDASLKITNGCRMILHYRHKIHIAHVFHESEAFYPIAVYYTIVKFDRNMKTLESGIFTKITVCPKVVTEELNNARKLFSYINLSKFLGYGNMSVPIKENQPGTTEMVCCRMDQVFLGNEPILQKNQLSVLDQVNQPKTDEEEATQQCRSTETANSDQHSTFLNSIYGMLFTAIFLSLTFNYTCQ